MEQLFSFTCPSKLGPSVGGANSVAHLSDRKMKRGGGEIWWEEARNPVLCAGQIRGWRTSVPDERKPRRHQRRSLSQKGKEQGFRVVEMSETSFDEGNLSCRELGELREEQTGNKKMGKIIRNHKSLGGPLLAGDPLDMLDFILGDLAHWKRLLNNPPILR